MDTAVLNKKLTDREKDDLLKEILAEKYTSAGNNLPILKSAIDIIGDIDDAMAFAELIPAVNAILANSRFISLVSSGASVFSIFLFPVGSMINVLDAYQVGQKMYAYRAIAYTLTAWAYDMPIPASSMKILRNIRTGSLVANKRALVEYRQVWERTSRSVISKLESELVVRGIDRKSMQITLRAISKNSAQSLCELILKGFESELPPIPRLTWKSNYAIKFPG